MSSIDAINGMDPRVARQLRKAGLRTTEGLLRRGASKRGRQELARSCSVTEAQVTVWVNTAELMQIRGIGGEYAHLLKTLGVGSVRELRRRNPKTLLTAIVELNERKRLVRRLPTEAMVAAWVEQAKERGPGG